MPAPYSNDLRGRVIAAFLKGQTRISILAKQFDLSSDTVRRYIAKYKDTGSVAPALHSGGRRAVIGVEQVNKLARVLAKKPDATIKQMCASYEKMHGQKATKSAMQRALKRFGIASKKSL